MGETERLYGVLDARLRERDFVAGAGRGRYSIADISLLGWVNVAAFAGLADVATRFPAVHAWFARCTTRPATARGLSVPAPAAIADAVLLAKVAEGGETAEREKEVAAFLEAAKTEFGYKYASP